MACLPVGGRPIVAHQVKYLETNGIFNIYVVVHHDAAARTRAFLSQYYEADPRSNIFLVVVSEEETETACALKLLFQLQESQEQMQSMPEYE